MYITTAATPSPAASRRGRPSAFSAGQGLESSAWSAGRMGSPIWPTGGVVLPGTIFPELTRCLSTKQWTVQIGTTAEIRMATHMYALCMCAEYKRLAPMHAFFSALACDTRPPPGLFTKTGVDVETLKKLSLQMHGEIIDLHSVEADIRSMEMAAFEESPSAGRLARLAGGEWTPVQWANAVGLTTLQMSGDELHSLFIPSWVEKKK